MTWEANFRTEKDRNFLKRFDLGSVWDIDCKSILIVHYRRKTSLTNLMGCGLKKKWFNTLKFRLLTTTTFLFKISIRRGKGLFQGAKTDNLHCFVSNFSCYSRVGLVGKSFHCGKRINFWYFHRTPKLSLCGKQNKSVSSGILKPFRPSFSSPNITVSSITNSHKIANRTVRENIENFLQTANLGDFTTLSRVEKEQKSPTTTTEIAQFIEFELQVAW